MQQLNVSHPPTFCYPNRRPHARLSTYAWASWGHYCLTLRAMIKVRQCTHILWKDWLY